MATAKINDANMITILVNQIRAEIGGYGGGISAPGGNALKHNKSLDLMVTRAQCKKAGFEKTHFMMNIKVAKSKILEAVEGSTCSCYFRLGSGIDNTMDIIMDAVDKDIIKKSTGWYKYKDINLQGYDKFAESIESNNLLDELVNSLNGEINEQPIEDKKEKSKK